MGLSGITSFVENRDIYQYIVIDRGGYMIGGVDDGDDSIYMDWDGDWNEEEGKENLTHVGSYFWGHTHSWYMNQWKMASARGDKFRVPGLYDGQFYVTVSANLGLQIFIPTPIGDLGVNILTYEIIRASFDCEELALDYFGKDGKARISTLQFNLIGFGTKYSIKHELGNDMRYVTGTNTSSVSIGIFSIDINGSFSISYSLGAFLVGSISITGNAYYEQN